MKSNDFYHGIFIIIIWIIVCTTWQCTQTQSCYDELKDINKELRNMNYEVNHILDYLEYHKK